jgi:hypothetical protein
MSMTVRLSARTECAVNALASRRHTRSDVVRDALEHYTATNGGDAGRGHPYDAWLDVIGVVSVGTRDRGRTTASHSPRSSARRPVRGVIVERVIAV